MTEPGATDPESDTADEPTSELGKALGRLKRDGSDADDPTVSDARTRLSWSSVTEAEPDTQRTPEAPRGSESAFRFDLGGALAKFGASAPGERPMPEPEPDPEVGEHTTEAPAERPLERPLESSAAPGPVAERPESASPPNPPVPTPPAAPPPAASPPPPPPPAAPPVVDAPLPQRGEPAPGDLPRRSAPAPLPADQLPRRRPAPASDEPSQRRAPEPVDELPRRRGDDAPARPRVESAVPPPERPTADQSVFDTSNPAPSLPRNPQRTPSDQPAAPVLPAATTAALPTLPPANPVVPPPIVDEPVTPSGSDVQAVRSFELKAQREKRKSRLAGVTFLAVVLIAGAVAVGLLFGRDWLFPTEWSEELIPLVDEIQLDNGAEFAEPVPLHELSGGDYAAAALEAAFGDDWATSFPQWRALGLASGAIDSPAIAGAVADWRPAIYDADAGVIYRVADRSEPASGSDATTESDTTSAAVADDGPDDDPGAASEATSMDEALRLALLQAYDDQRGVEAMSVEGPVGLTGVSSARQIAVRAVDRALLAGSTDVPTIDPDVAIALPLLYEMIAIDVFGEPILDAADVDPEPQYGDRYPDDVVDALVTDHPIAAIGALPDGAEPIGEPVALGPDAWALVWQNRLPDPTTLRLRALVTADAYQPYVLGDQGCVAAAFEAPSDINAGEVVTALTAWATAAPLEASPSISISTTDPARVQFTTCDPGASAQQSVAPSTVTGLIDRQLDALG